MASKRPAAKIEETQTPAAQGLPLFFKQPAVIDKERHADAAVVTTTTYEFARRTNSIALNTIEFIEAGKSYPVVFTDGENPFPIAVVGLEKENYFVEKNGSWNQDYYIPAYARQYPFIFFEQPDDQKFYLCIDEGAPHFRTMKEANSLALFNDDGTPSELTNNALQFCSEYYQQHTITRSFCADLKKHGLLVPYQSQVKFNSGKIINLAQFLIIDEAALAKLSDEVFLEFRQKGWLAFIYLAITSATNWKRLLNHGEQAGAAAA